MIYRKEIDGLRALAVIPVMLFHAGFKIFEGGFIGVDIFFVISGYLITYIIIDQLSKNKFSLKNFYERRAKRILPALFLVMVACFPFAFFLMKPYQIIDFSESVLSTSFFGSNFLFFFESGYFDGPSELKPLLHTWSLAVEEQFYLFFPLFLILFWRIGIKFIVISLFLVFLLSFSLSEFFSYYRPSFNFFMLPTRGWELLVGSFISLFLFQKYRSNVPPKFKYSNILSIVGSIMVLFSIFYIDSTTRFPSAITLIPVLGTGLLIMFTVSGTFLYLVLTNRTVVFFGLLSYSLYLWHQPILVFGRIFFENNFNHLIASFLLTASVAISYLSWKFFEVPLRTTNFKQNNVFISVFLSMISSIFIYQFVILNQGFYIQKNIYNYQYTLTDQNFAKYVSNAQRSIEKIDFPENSKDNVLIIGDSFSQDLINVIFESKYELNFNLSSIYIPFRCKNLNVNLSTLKSMVKVNDYPRCFNSDSHYNSEEVINILNQADQVWLVSDWEREDLDLLGESINNIKNFSKSSILIFETKTFGGKELHRNKYYNLPKEEILKYRFMYPEKEKFINHTVKQFRSISLMDYYCENNKCRISDDNGFLLSHDGSHLTKEGATFFSKKINFNLIFENNK